MSLPATTRVLIVGAGPTGLTLAIELARRGIDCLLIDQRPEPLAWDRATVIHSRTLEIFDALGVVDDFLERGHRMVGVTVFAYGKACTSLRFDGIDSRYPFDLNLSEQITEAILTRRLAGLGAGVHRGLSFVGFEARSNGVTAQLKDGQGHPLTVEADWLIGTDGLHSAVRSAMGLEVEGHAYETLWGVVDGTLADWAHDPAFGAVQIEPPSVNPLPLAPDRWRVYFRADGQASAQAALPQIQAGLGSLSPGARLVQHNEPRFFRTHRQLSPRFAVGRVVLAGDAAHACSPIEGHGMNAGIQDAYNLGWKLALVIEGRAGEELIDSYDPERRPVVDSFGASGDAAEQLRAVPNDRAAVERVKRTIMAATSSSPGRYQVALAESELEFRYGPSTLISSRHPGGPEAVDRWLGARPGDRAPDAGGLWSPAGERRVFELLRVQGFVVLALVTHQSEVDPSLRALEQALDALGPLVSLWLISTDDTAPLPGDRWLLDAHGTAHARYGAIDPTLVVIRPDDRVGLRCEGIRADDVLAYLDDFLSLTPVLPAVV